MCLCGVFGPESMKSLIERHFSIILLLRLFAGCGFFLLESLLLRVILLLMTLICQILILIYIISSYISTLIGLQIIFSKIIQKSILVMIKKAFKSFNHSIGEVNNLKSINNKNLRLENINVIQNKKYYLGHFRIQYFFSRKLFNSPKTEQKKQPIKEQVFNTSKTQQKIKTQSSELYSFTDLDSDLEKYQSFLNIFNTHTKKVHEKLLTNQIKIISTIIQKKRDDLLQKFLAVNYRNRLANPQTIKLISQYFKQQLSQNIDKVVTSSEYCQMTLQRITLLTQFNNFELFDEFFTVITNKLNLKNDQNKNLQIINSLTSKESQLLFIYNLLIKQKQLHQSIMKSKYFGLNTDNLKFYKLGEVFYEFRKFIRRYFAIFSKKVQTQNKDQIKQEDFKTYQKQAKKSSQASLIEENVFCFLKTMDLKSVRKQILIDGFTVDFVVEKQTPNQKLLKKQSSPQNTKTYILEVMGSYHYTSNGQLKGRDLRKLILLGSKYRSKEYIVRILHFEDYNKSKGHQNKKELIKYLLESTDKRINWQPKNQGYDSKWQLKQDYEQFK